MKKMNYPVTYTLIGINVLLFVLETLAGGSTNTSVALRFGAFYAPYVQQRGQIWRLVTSAFLHFGVTHIACNMYTLYAIGRPLERICGPAKFLVIYFVAAICGNLLTWVIENARSSYAVSAGASGALFGLFGVLLAMAILPHGLAGYRVSMRNILITLGINLVYGFAAKNVNMAAHAGGLIAGFLLSLILFR